MATIRGLLEFKSNIIVRGDALGKKYKAIIGKQPLVIVLPRLPDEPKDFGNYLLPPYNRPGKDSADWGILRAYNSIEYTPETCCVEVAKVYLECPAENIDSAVEDIFSNIDEWRDLLETQIHLAKNISINGYKPGYSERSGVELYISEPTIKRFDPHSRVHLHGVVYEAENSLKSDELQDIFSNTINGKKIKLEYDLLVQSYIERAKGNYRISMVQALSAIELCLDRILSDLCKVKDIDTLIFSKKSLGDKFEFIRAFKLKWLTKNPNEEITSYRNSIFHNRTISPSISELNKVVSVIEQYLSYYVPDYFEYE